MSVAVQREAIDPAYTRLMALAAMRATDVVALQTLTGESHRIRARSELLREGETISRPLLVISGWAARMRELAGGRRQVLGLFLPGDMIGIARQQRAEMSNVVALTDITVRQAPAIDELDGYPGLAAAYDLSRALKEHYLLAQITRLGRFTAYERMADLLLELHERLELVGLAADGHFPLPLTQEVLGDTLGLTSVHVNRTLQALRREGTLTLRNGMAILHDPAALIRQVDHRAPPR